MTSMQDTLHQKESDLQRISDEQKNSDKKRERIILAFIFLIFLFWTLIYFIFKLKQMMKHRKCFAACKPVTIRAKKIRRCRKVCWHKSRIFYQPSTFVSEEWGSVFTYKAWMEIRNNEGMKFFIKQSGAVLIFYAKVTTLFLSIFLCCPAVFKWNFKRWVFFTTIVVSINVVKTIIKLRTRQIAVYVIGLMKGSLSQIFKIMFLTVFTFDIETTTTSYQYRVTV